MSNQQPSRLETLRSLRRRGLMPQQAYEAHLEALGILPSLTTNGHAPATKPARSLPRPVLEILAIFMALLGGLLGIGGAIVQEFQSGGGLLAVVIGAPVIEEALKPAGIYLLLLWWPQAIRGRVHTAALTALSGLCFGLIESYFYVNYYYPEGGDDFVLFRFTVPVTMHAVASFVVGLGLSRQLIDWGAGRQKLPKAMRNFYLGGVAIHAVYNTLAVISEAVGVLDFE